VTQLPLPTACRLATYLLLSLFISRPAAVQGQSTVQDLFVASFAPSLLTRVDGRTGQTVYSVASGPGYYVTQGPDGALYGMFGKRDPATGTPVRPPQTLATYGLDFGADGNLYVGDQFSGFGRIRRVDPANFALSSEFVAAGPGSLKPVEAIKFGPDGNLYVTETNGNRILRYNGSTGAFLGVFGSASQLISARSMDWGPNGNLFVAGLWSNNVVEFNGSTGAYERVFASGLNTANGLAFGPDGHLYVGLESDGTIVRVNGTTGEFIDNFATGLPQSIVGMTWATVQVPEPDAVLLWSCLSGAAGLMRRRRGRLSKLTPSPLSGCS
jgi:streptogramin lyase